MYIPLAWAISLAAAGMLYVTVVVAIAAQRRAVALPERPFAGVAYLLGGGLTGIMALEFPPAWPVLAAICGVLVLLALQARRVADIGLLLAGFGSTWVLVISIAVLSAATDSVVYSPDLSGWFVFGAAVLIGGAVIAIVAAARTMVRSRPPS